MAAFSSSFQQQHPFLFDSVVNSPSSINNNNNNNNNNMYALLEEPNNPNSNTCFSQFYQPLETLIHNLDHSTNITALSNNINEASVFSVTNKNSMDSSSIVTDHKYHEHHHMSSDQIIQKELNPTNKKRKSKQASLANSAQSKDMREVKGKKEKKKKDGELEKKNKCKEIEMKATEEGYIHVRARRGQATDSHSLAERVRRERISERMKVLQALVPGCDKVTGKALMLDEIINYVQSLQNQVEFLSMKLASVNPMFYDFGMDLEPFMVRPDQNLSNLSSPLPTMQQFSSTTASNYPLMDNSANSLLFQQAQLPNTLLPQGDRQVLWEVDDQIRQRIVNQSGFSNNLFSFH